MLRAKRVDLSVTYPVLVNKDNIIDKVGNNKIVRAKVDTRMAKSKSKNKKLIKFLLEKF